MGSLVSPIVADLYMEEVERKALDTYSGEVPSHWFRYVDDTWVKIKRREIDFFSEHINSVDINIKFTKEEMLDNKLPFLDCAIRVGEDRRLQVEVYRKPTHTDQYLLFDSHHPLEQKLGVIRTLQHRAESIPTFPEAREQENNHIKQALKKCGYPNWTFIKTHTKRKREVKQSEQRRYNFRKKTCCYPLCGWSI